ncbi:hypothetical protein ACVWZZ_002261 [Bradyrhizobium sp. LM6.10]|jgi:hypothetical protein
MTNAKWLHQCKRPLRSLIQPSVIYLDPAGTCQSLRPPTGTGWGRCGLLRPRYFARLREIVKSVDPSNIAMTKEYRMLLSPPVNSDDTSKRWTARYIGAP